jgi:DNA-binding PadR family transcriptional regulator
MSKFQGFGNPQENWSKLPHQLIEALPQIETVGEMKVIIYTLRHTWGYHDDYKKITLDEFENGRKQKDGTRIDEGTGLTKPTIINGIKRAVAHGFLFEHTDITDLARVKKFYSLTEEGLKDLTSGVKTFNTEGKKILHRTEKETKEKKLKKELPSSKNKRQSESLNNLATSLAEKICKLDIDTSSQRTKEDLKTLTVALHKKGVVFDDPKIPDFFEWWEQNDWRGQKGGVPTPAQVGDKWGEFEGQYREQSNGRTEDLSKGFYV